MLYSFDIFDTLITRKVATPDGIFALMQRELISSDEYSDLSDHIIDNFYTLRQRAERDARAVCCDAEHDEVTLEQIYRILGLTGCNDNQARRLISLEKRTELENIIGVRGNMERYFGLKEAGERAVLISDMYLEESDVRKMLVKADPRFSDAVIYMSSAYKKSKSTGRLYSLVKEMEGAEYSKWEHRGDNPVSDMEIPSRLGIKADGIAGKVLLPIEEHAIRYLRHDSNAQLIIGASANARMNRRDDAVRDGRKYDYGTSLIAPVVTGYTRWLLSQVMERGIRKLYFIARDGYLLRETADKMILQEGLPIETHYIYGSRKAWRPALFIDGGFDVADFFKRTDDDDMSLEGMARRFGISADELVGFLPEGYGSDSYPAQRKQREEIIGLLQGNEDFRSCISRRTETERELIREYLTQSIDLEVRDYAFVELVGSGYTQFALSKIMREITDYPMLTFYYHIDGGYGDDMCKFLSYCPGMMNRKAMEPLFSAPHGCTSGYQNDPLGRVMPMLDDAGRVFEENGMDDFQKGFLAFLDNIDIRVSGNLMMESLYDRYISDTPDTELMDFIGDNIFSNSGRDEAAHRFAPKLSEEDLNYMFRLRLMEPILLFYHGADYQYSLQRLTEAERANIERLKEERGLASTQKDRIAFWRKSPVPWVQAAGCEVLMSRAGRRIALYGAGNVGRMLSGIIELDEDKELAVWVDRGYERLSKDGWPVEPVEKLYSTDYDSVIIAIANPGVAKDIRRYLISNGVERDRIVTYA
ncbi:MAG: hypothetical protein IJT96_01635 [Lachnospiraceae bacterium]|nr:hypothetical protein [Lachnospiraceae bacterium]